MTFVASLFGSGEARRGSIPRSGAVTEKQRSQNRKATQPSGRRFFLDQTLLLAPYRALKGMRVARALSGPKIPRRKRHRIYELEYLAGLQSLVMLATVCWAVPIARAAMDSGAAYSNPVLAGDYPDPSVIRVGKDFWAAATSSEWGPQFPILHSRDLVNWKIIGAVFPKRPGWATGNFWAPEISE